MSNPLCETISNHKTKSEFINQLSKSYSDVLFYFNKRTAYVGPTSITKIVIFFLIKQFFCKKKNLSIFYAIMTIEVLF